MSAFWSKQCYLAKQVLQPHIHVQAQPLEYWNQAAFQYTTLQTSNGRQRRQEIYVWITFLHTTFGGPPYEQHTTMHCYGSWQRILDQPTSRNHRTTMGEPRFNLTAQNTTLKRSKEATSRHTLVDNTRDTKEA